MSNLAIRNFYPWFDELKKPRCVTLFVHPTFTNNAADFSLRAEPPCSSFMFDTLTRIFLTWVATGRINASQTSRSSHPTAGHQPLPGQPGSKPLSTAFGVGPTARSFPPRRSVEGIPSLNYTLTAAPPRPSSDPFSNSCAVSAIVVMRTIDFPLIFRSRHLRRADPDIGR